MKRNSLFCNEVTGNGIFIERYVIGHKFRNSSSDFKAYLFQFTHGLETFICIIYMLLNGVKVIKNRDQIAYDRVEWRSLVKHGSEFRVFRSVCRHEEFCLLGYNAVYLGESSQHLGGTCLLHLQGRRARNQYESGNKQQVKLISCLAYSANREAEGLFASKRRLTFTELRATVCQKTEIFITTALGA
jgi:hypothetical protein